MSDQTIIFTVLNLRAPDYKILQQSMFITAHVNSGFRETSCLSSRYPSQCQELAVNDQRLLIKTQLPPCLGTSIALYFRFNISGHYWSVKEQTVCIFLIYFLEV